ncbi:hypothetical protein GCM10010112_33970 [Actinoplanes lobatus]|uniref:Uncharacterized protein n=1 Tax=Actinoplanes lobatus TaxID=113568 RepID=A0A7W7HHM4_9ACTN|nr:hypothetical protein [Actinoplanes lobatus]MBB4750711.1 hypothetical protein [Actinoplanes lobatus]GGN68970.1 hypothetical protein GCM10010112_33970 [Actinoplanes lobatus]GIE42151.1 hypothetical protein Alo02nite_50490 [Actinoplanes lobatus]
MSVLTRPAVLLASAAVAASLLVAPGAAYAADTTTELTAAEMKTALEQVSAASDSAAAVGWKGAAEYSFALSGDVVKGTETITADRAHGRLSDVVSLSGYGTTTVFMAEGAGVYQSIADTQSKAALKMMGRASVTYAFAADKTIDLDDNTPGVGDLSSDNSVPGTKTVHDDGSADYAFSAEDGVVFALHVNVDSVLTGTDVTVTEDGSTIAVSLDYSYGPQSVTLPTAGQTIDYKTLATGVAYLDMPATVQQAAKLGAADTRKAAKGRKVKVSTLRKVVRTDVSTVNSKTGVNMVKVKNVTSGVNVYAVNPWTKKTVKYSVKASGKKVVVKKL